MPSHESPSDNLGAHSGGWHPADAAWLGALIALALTLRMVFFTGFFGSDDIDVAEQALRIAHGDWTVPTYIGVLRYGVTIPMAFFISLFGYSEFSASLWPFLCSVAEVALVFVVAQHMWGRRAAIFSALILATSPLHVNHAGRIYADPQLALFITASLFLFWLAERKRTASLYLLTGLCAGGVFWMKEVVFPIYVCVFVLYALVFRAWNWQWLWGVFGACMMLAGNALLFWGLAGDPLYYIKVIARRQEVTDAVIASGHLKSVVAPWFYYFQFLLFDVRHTWTLGFLALWGVATALADRILRRLSNRATDFVVLWAGGLVLLFSVFPVKIAPVTFVFKQTNYMLIFLAPLALLAGLAMSRLEGWKGHAILVVALSGSVILSAFEQQAIRVFTANSRAAWAFAKRHEGAAIYATVNAVNIAGVLALMEGKAGAAPRVQKLSELGAAAGRAPGGGGVAAGREKDAYVILDQETMGWGNNPRIGEERIPGCWSLEGRLRPEGFGAGAQVVQIIRAAGGVLPQWAGQALEARLAAISRPKPAPVYRVPAGCNLAIVA